MENQIEKGPERIPTKEEVMGIISHFAERSTILPGREQYDEKGLFLLEVEAEIKQPDGGSIHYEYVRQGRFSFVVDGKNRYAECSANNIHREHYDKDGIPEPGGQDVAVYHSETGEWKELKD